MLLTLRNIFGPLSFLVFFATAISPGHTQFYDSTLVVAEGGMRFTRRNQDNIRMINASVAGNRAGGSASVPGGGIKVGAASSEVLSELNPLFLSEDGILNDLFVAGNMGEWGSVVHDTSGNPPVAKRVSSQVTRGKLDHRLVQLLLDMQPDDDSSEIALTESKLLFDPVTGSSSRILRFTENAKNLQLLLDAKDADGISSTSGVHILQLSEPVNSRQNTRGLLARQASPQFQAWAKSMTSNQSRENELNPVFIPYGESSPNDNVIHLANLQTASVSQSQTLFTILGFSKALNPNSGKRSAISAFATNNRTTGSVIVQPGQTIADLAALYGATVQELMQANNLISPDVDISGFPLIIPADLSTVGFEQALEGDTPAIMAQRYNIDLSWLLNLNDISDPGQFLQIGTNLRIPGRRPLGSVVLPAATPQPPELEYADYGAYTTYEVTYNIEGSLTPLFQRTLINTFR